MRLARFALAVVLACVTPTAAALRLPRAALALRMGTASNGVAVALSVVALLSSPLEAEALGMLKTAPSMTIAVVCDSSGRCTQPTKTAAPQLSATKLKKDTVASAERLQKDVSRASKEAQKAAARLTTGATKALPVDAQKAVNKAGRSVDLAVNKAQRGASKEASKLSKEAQKASKGAAKLVPKDVQQAAGRLQKASADGERARSESMQNMLKSR